MKSQEKRVTKLCEGVSNAARIRAVLDAIRADDTGLRRKLLKSTPRLSYRVHDLQVIDSIEAAEILSLRFDGTFYKIMAYFLSLQCPQNFTKHDPKKLKAATENMENEMCALINGAEIFAERIGLELGQVLAFSIALDDEMVGLEWPLDILSEEDRWKANEFADVFQEVWAKWGNSIEDFGKAA